MGIDRETRSDKALQGTLRGKLRRLQYWLVWLSFAFLSLAGWMRMIDTLADWEWLDRLGVSPGPRYLAATGALWGLAGLVAAIWLLFHFPSGRAAATVIALGVAISYWIDRLFVGQAPLAASNAPFVLLLTLFWLVIVFQVLRSGEVLGSLFRRFGRGQAPASTDRER